MQSTFSKLEQLFTMNQIGSWAFKHGPGLVLAVIVFAAFYLCARVLSSIAGRLMKRVELDRTVAGFLLIILRYVFLIFGAVVALEQLNINITSIVAGLGIIGVSIGFAAQATLSNVIAGIFIFWDKPFVIGDLIEASDEYGEVREITLRSTRITTSDGKVVSIPNSILINNKIKCYTMQPYLRLDVDVTVGIGEDIEAARKGILPDIESDKRFLKAPAPALVVTRLDTAGIGLQLRAWLAEPRTHIEVTDELRERLKKLFYDRSPRS